MVSEARKRALLFPLLLYHLLSTCTLPFWTIFFWRSFPYTQDYLKKELPKGVNI
jgi:hypothetical protein